MVSKFWPIIKDVNARRPYQHSQHSIQRQHQPSVSIRLLEEVLYIHRHSNPVLRGVVDIQSKKPIIMSSLRLDFSGHLEYRLPKADLSCQKHFANCSVILYSSGGKPQTIQGENIKPTRFLFEMPLPNNHNDPDQCLIQSVRCQEFQVDYRIKGLLEYQPYNRLQQDDEEKAKDTKGIRGRQTSNVVLTSSSKPVIIVQLPTHDAFSSSDYMLSTIDSRKNANPWCQYHVIVDKKFAAIASMLNISIRLAPSIQGLKLGHVSVEIVQRFTVTHSEESAITVSRTPIPLPCHYQSTPFPSSFHPGGTLYEGEFGFKIPHSQSTYEGNRVTDLIPTVSKNTVSNIKVDHLLLVHLSLTYPRMSHDGGIRRAKRVLTFQCDFHLLDPCVVEESDHVLNLPLYHSSPTFTKDTLPVLDDSLLLSSPPLYHQIALFTS